MVFARQIVDLMLLRCGPQDLPGDRVTLGASAAAYCILLFLQVGLIAPLGRAAVQAVLATVLLGLYVSVVLRLRKLPNRFPQTATALFSAGATLTLIMLAPTHAMTPYLQAVSHSTHPQSVPMPPGLVVFAYIAVGFWGLAIYSHIYRHALNCSIWLGFGAAISFEVFLFAVFSVLG